MGYASAQQLIVDNGSLANFVSWASAISAAITAMGWVKTADTGQVVWTTSVSVVGISAALVSGGNIIYTYTLTSGPALAAGSYITITGMADSNNNGTFLISAVGGGTFTRAGTGTTRTVQTGVGTTPVVPPSGGGGYVYEIWKPTDSLQTGASQFFLKMEYGSSFSVNQPSVQASISTATSGAGVLTGFAIAPNAIPSGGTNGQGDVQTFECDFSGDTNRLGMILWRDNYITTGQNGAIVIERLKNSDGTDSTEGVTLGVFTGSSAAYLSSTVRTIVFGVGLSVLSTSGTFIVPAQSGSTSQELNNAIPISPLFPNYGKYGNPHTVLAIASPIDVVEGMKLTTTLYGATRTYIASKRGTMGGMASNGSWATLLRFD